MRRCIHLTSWLFACLSCVSLAAETSSNESLGFAKVEDDLLIYQGNVVNGVKAGFGVEKSKINETGYIGFFENGQRAGFGLLVDFNSVLVVPSKSGSDFKSRVVYLLKQGLLGFGDYDEESGAQSFAAWLNPKEFMHVEKAQFGIAKNRALNGYGISILGGEIYYGFHKDGRPIESVLMVQTVASGDIWVNFLPVDNKGGLAGQGYCANLTSLSIYSCEMKNKALDRTKKLGSYTQ